MTRRPSTWPSAIQASRCYIKEAGLPFHLMQTHERGHCIGPAAYLHNSNSHARLSRFELRPHESNQSTSRYAHRREQSSALCFLATSQWQVRPLRGPVKTLVYIGCIVSFQALQKQAPWMLSLSKCAQTADKSCVCICICICSKTQAIMDYLCPRLHCSSIAANSSGQCPIVSRHSMH